MRDAAALGRHVVEKAVADARVAVARAAVGHPREIAGHGFLAVRAERVDGRRQRALVAGFDIEDVADEAVLLAVVPDDLRFGAGNPLQHAALLPAPGLRLAEGNPFVFLVQINHADLDHIVRGGRAMLEADFVGEHKAVVGRELQLVVVAEPVELRSPRDLPHRRERARLCSQRAAGSEQTAGGGRRQGGLQELAPVDLGIVGVHHCLLLSTRMSARA